MDRTIQDRKLRAQILEELLADPRIDTRKVSVDVIDGIAVLSGRVPTYVVKCLCEEAVKRVCGITEVSNRLEVRLTIGDYRTDATLKRLADEILGCLAHLPQEYPRASVFDGWITLNGTVPWEFQKHLAEEVVSKIAGVRGINNRIRVGQLLSSGHAGR